jgi:hypothetical protein
MDVGAVVNGYSGDVSATFPANGHFTTLQARLYEGLLARQRKLIDAVKPGLDLRLLYKQVNEAVVDLALELGLIYPEKAGGVPVRASKSNHPGSDAKKPLFERTYAAGLSAELGSSLSARAGAVVPRRKKHWRCHRDERPSSLHFPVTNGRKPPTREQLATRLRHDCGDAPGSRRSGECLFQDRALHTVTALSTDPDPGGRILDLCWRFCTAGQPEKSPRAQHRKQCRKCSSARSR